MVSRFIARKMGEGDPQRGKASTLSNLIAWISVALSITVMVVAIAVVAGFKSEIRAKATGFMGSAILVAPGQTPLNELYPLKDSLSYGEEILSLSNVHSMAGVAYRSGMVKTADNIHGLYFKGVDSLYDFSFFDTALIEGRVPEFGSKISNDILISKRVANLLKYKCGDDLVAYFIGEDVKVRKFNICGIYDAQLEEIDRTMVIVDKRHVQRLNGWEKDEVSSIEVRFAPKADIPKLSREIEEVVFECSTNEDPSLFVTPLTRIYGHLFDWLALLDLNVLMVLALMMAVAGFNMISAILIILFEKISMIGLLKSLGMTNSGIRDIFLYRSAAIVGKGLLWGNVFALVICLVQKYLKVISLNPDNYFVKFVPIDYQVGQVVLINLVCVVVIMAILSLSTLFISRVSPDKTMRVN